MKIIKYVITLFVLYILGYFLQPYITPLIVKDRVVGLELSQEVSVDGKVVKVNLVELEDALYPKELTLKETLTNAESEDRTMVRTFEKDQRSNFLERREGLLLVKDPNSENFTTLISPELTNVYEELAATLEQKRLQAVEDKKQELEALAQQADQARKERQQAQQGTPAEETESMASQEAEPEPAAEEVPSAPVSAEQIVTMMKESIGSGVIKEFKADQVQEWAAAEDEVVDGESYQVGLVSYQAETIFGVQAVQAKALIRNGKIQRWVYAKTGMEIR